jgi:membrane-bound lytic murein transglycosylase D
MTITSYNHGINGMKRAHSRYGQDFMRMVREYDSPLFGFASRNYYAEFLAAREIASQPERYFSGSFPDAPP